MLEIYQTNLSKYNINLIYLVTLDTANQFLSHPRWSETAWSRCHQSNSWRHHPPHMDTEKKLSYKILGYILNCKLKHVSVPCHYLWPSQKPPPWTFRAGQVSGMASWLWRKAESLGISIPDQDDLSRCCSGWWEEESNGCCSAPHTIRMLTMIIKKYLSMSKSKDREGETVLLTNNKGDWEFTPSNKREEAVKFWISIK